jgi:hypothetical protein
MLQADISTSARLVLRQPVEKKAIKNPPQLEPV